MYYLYCQFFWFIQKYLYLRSSWNNIYDHFILRMLYVYNCIHTDLAWIFREDDVSKHIDQNWDTVKMKCNNLIGFPEKVWIYLKVALTLVWFLHHIAQTQQTNGVCSFHDSFHSFVCVAKILYVAFSMPSEDCSEGVWLNRYQFRKDLSFFGYIFIVEIIFIFHI